jgi:phosphate transport system substrate-binding protein
MISLPIILSFDKKQKVHRVSRTIVLTEIILIEVLLLNFNFYSEVLLFIVQLAIIILAVWNILGVSNRRRIVYLVVFLLTIVLVSGVNNYIESNTKDDYPKPLKEQNYEPFTAGNVLAELDQLPDIEFNRNYPLPKLDGATAMYPYYAAVYQALYDENTDKEKYLNCYSSEYAFNRLEKGDADILFLAGVSDYQRKTYEFSFTETPLCKDAFVFVTSYQNPVDDLSVSELKKIYTGEAENWEEFGGTDLPIILYQLMGENMGSNIALSEYIGEANDMTIYEYTPSMSGMVFNVYRNGKGSLGYTYRFFVTEMMKNYEVKLLSVNDTSPTIENIENGSYPFIKTFVAVHRDDNTNPNVQILIDWLKGQQGQELAEKTGYVPINFTN